MPVREKPVRPETREALHEVLNQAQLKAGYGHIGRHDWAGEYGFGGGLSRIVRLVLTPDGDAVYAWFCDIGMPEWDIGHVIEVRPDRILIEWGDPSTWRFKEVADVLFRVRWGGRHYLIPEHRMIEFCNDVNSGREVDISNPNSLFNWRMHLLRDVDIVARVEGMPDVPLAYRKYLLKRPISVEITNVVAEASDSDIWDNYIVEVDAGANVGLLPQMTLFTESNQSDCWMYEAEVIAVERNTSRVRVQKTHGLSDSVPCVGDMLTTRNGRTCSLERDETSVMAD